jgi:hypothetical protein
MEDKNTVYWQIRHLLTISGIWAAMQNCKVYTPESLINELGENKISDDIKNLLTEKVSRLQRYLDERIIELKN